VPRRPNQLSSNYTLPFCRRLAVPNREPDRVHGQFFGFPDTARERSSPALVQSEVCRIECQRQKVRGMRFVDRRPNVEVLKSRSRNPIERAGDELLLGVVVDADPEDRMRVGNWFAYEEASELAVEIQLVIPQDGGEARIRA
jgi:hypothetical protein